MTKAELEAWLATGADNVAQALAAILDRERGEILELERQLASEPSIENVTAELGSLVSDGRELDRRLATLREQVAVACERQLDDLSQLLTRCETSARGVSVREAQALFDSLAPGDLSASIEISSRKMLERNLRESGLPSKLQNQVATRLERCRVTLVDDSWLTTLTEVEATHAGLSDDVTALEERLKAHDVAPAVIKAVELLRDPDWFLAEVVDVYATAAEAEEAWRLPRQVLKELGLES